MIFFFPNVLYIPEFFDLWDFDSQWDVCSSLHFFSVHKVILIYARGSFKATVRNHVDPGDQPKDFSPEHFIMNESAYYWTNYREKRKPFKVLKEKLGSPHTQLSVGASPSASWPGTGRSCFAFAKQRIFTCIYIDHSILSACI